MVKRLVSSIVVTSCLWATVNLSNFPQPHHGFAQEQATGNLSATWNPSQAKELLAVVGSW